MRLNPKNHSSVEVNFLGTKISGTTPGEDALHIALDRLFYHDNTGPFFARQMIQRLVTSNPSPGYVQRVATVFGNNGSGVRGDLKAVWTAILTDEEARVMPTAADTLSGRLREPMLRFVHWARTAEVDSDNGEYRIGDLSDSDTSWARVRCDRRRHSTFSAPGTCRRIPASPPPASWRPSSSSTMKAARRATSISCSA